MFPVAILFFSAFAVSAQTEPGLSRSLVAMHKTYSVVKGDSLSSIGARFGVELNRLEAENGLTGRSRLVPGKQLTVNSIHLVPELPEWGIVVNIPQRLLFYAEEGKEVLAYPAAVGKPGWATPTGHFQIAGRERNPTWVVPVSIQNEMRRLGEPVVARIPPGPDNPLGARWMSLSESGCGIHGTNAPASIYGFRTHGCIRLHPVDVGELFDRVVVGLPVDVIYQPALLGLLDDGDVYVEVNPDPYHKVSDALEKIRVLAAKSGIEREIDWDLVEDTVERKEGVARRVGPTHDAPN